MAIETREVEIKQLLFDPHNPRLPELLGKNQTEIFRFLIDEIGIEDVLQSIAASGVIEGDPIIARKAENVGQFYVIEGNRRLAALKLLNGEKIGDGNEEPTDVPKVSDAVAPSIKKVKIQLGWTEQDLDAYLGYKHVTATREWPPEAKARFVISKVKGDFAAENLKTFAKRLGTTLPTLRRWLVAFLTLDQAKAAGKFEPKEAYAKRYFGTFYTLLGSQEVQTFLALTSDPITATPVPPDHLPQLEEFIKWCIGTKKDPPVINSRKQQELDAVLSSPSALRHFRLRRDLDAALLYTEYNAKEISAKLLNAAYGIEECLPKLFDVREDAAVVSAIESLDAAYKKLQINVAKPQPSKAR
jgi:ParB-like nuclease domain